MGSKSNASKSQNKPSNKDVETTVIEEAKDAKLDKGDVAVKRDKNGHIISEKKQEQIKKSLGKKKIQSSEQARQMGSKGGKRSQELRAEKRNAKQIAEAFGDMAIPSGQKNIQRWMDEMGIPKTQRNWYTALICSAYKHGMQRGDGKLIELVLKLRDDLPSDKVNLDVKAEANVHTDVQIYMPELDDEEDK